MAVYLAAIKSKANQACKAERLTRVTQAQLETSKVTAEYSKPQVECRQHKAVSSLALSALFQHLPAIAQRHAATQNSQQNW